MKIFLTFFLAIGLHFSASSQTLKEAIDAKDTVLAAKLIKAGANPNAIDENGGTLLMNTCHFPDVPMASFLLRHGANANKPVSPKGRNALMVACAYWCGMDMVKLLVDFHADVNATDKDGMTALMLAAKNEKQDVVDFLLKHGAHAKLKDAKGQTALDYAKAGKVEDYMIKSIKDTRFSREAVMESLEKAMR